MNIKTLEHLYEAFDALVDGNTDLDAGISLTEADRLFASSYIRGFISLSASEFGDESQPLSTALADIVTAKLAEARAELTPQDQQLVSNYWFDLKAYFTH